MESSWTTLVDVAVNRTSRWHSANTDGVRTRDLLGDHLIAELRHLVPGNKVEESLVFCADKLRRQLEEYEKEARVLVKLADTGRVVAALESALKTCLDSCGSFNDEVAEEWRGQLHQERSDRMDMYNTLLKDKDRLRREIGDECQQMELQTRLKHDLSEFSRVLWPLELDMMAAIFDVVVRLSGVMVMALPKGFATSSVAWPDAEKSEMAGEEACLRQVGMWLELRHQNVRQCYGLCHVGSVPFVIHGKSSALNTLESSSGFDGVWKLVLDFAHGLQCVHSKGFVHQQLSIANLQVSSEHKGVLSGMGLMPLPVNSSHGSGADALVHSDVRAFVFIILNLLRPKYPTNSVAEQQCVETREEIEHRNDAYPPASVNLPENRPAFVKEAAWCLLTGMCPSDTTEQWDLQHIVHELKEMGREVPPSTVSEAVQSGEQQVDIAGYCIADLNQTIDESLKDAKEEVKRSPRDYGNLYARLADVYDQLEAKTPVPRALVEDFSQLVFRFICQLEDDADTKFGVASNHNTGAKWDIALHWDIDQLLEDGRGILVKHNKGIHQWWRTSMEYKRQMNQEMPPSAHDAKWLISPDEVKWGELIAKGSFGVVYKGMWLGLKVVVKRVIRTGDKRVYMAQFIGEADLWYSLNHMYLVRMYGAWVKGWPSFVCERAIHGTLEDFCKNKEKAREEVWRLLYMAARGLEHLHERGIAHGDLKGNNIFVCEFEIVKLGDFGLSVVLKHDLDPATCTDRAPGAIRWKAPECLEGDHPSLESDIYSFGMCILEALTRQYPWWSIKDDNVVAHYVTQGKLPKRPESFSDTEWNLVKRMCCLEPKSRITVGTLVGIAYGLYIGSSQRTYVEPKRTFSAQESKPESPESLVPLQNDFDKLVISRVPPTWYIAPELVEFKKHLGDGCVYSVHEALYASTPVVVKRVLTSTLSVDARKQFHHKASLWFSLEHPNVIKLYGACDIEQPFFVCALAAKGTITSFARENHNIIWQLLRGAASGLQYLHKKGVVHGNLKGSNILVTARNQAKITDFGWSFSIRQPHSTTVDGGVLGGFRWKAPEVLQGGKATFASDIYAFGMCIVEAVTGKLPWGSSIPDAVVKHNVMESRLMPSRPEELNDEQWRLVTRMCAFDPEERIGADAVVWILETFCSPG